ncbi:uncharacterized protein LOC126971422 isoform X2 [Leptidea sinapis]|uniref:uncharacterized protein LOC126971422 isoform X2 n=1 Tax=Leptidea sinapis TaxID=189913 RepID=UPI00213A225B|nr:uncharacterized protein LOC126971422 isoform X2 [Leptidea sinapis]
MAKDVETTLIINSQNVKNSSKTSEADSTRTTATNLSQERLTNINIWPTSRDREGDNSSHTLLQRVLLNSHNRNFNCAQDKITPEVRLPGRVEHRLEQLQRVWQGCGGDTPQGVGVGPPPTSLWNTQAVPENAATYYPTCSEVPDPYELLVSAADVVDHIQEGEAEGAVPEKLLSSKRFLVNLQQQFNVEANVSVDSYSEFVRGAALAAHCSEVSLQLPDSLSNSDITANTVAQLSSTQLCAAIHTQAELLAALLWENEERQKLRHQLEGKMDHGNIEELPTWEMNHYCHYNSVEDMVHGERVVAGSYRNTSDTDWGVELAPIQVIGRL